MSRESAGYASMRLILVEGFGIFYNSRAHFINIRVCIEVKYPPFTPTRKITMSATKITAWLALSGLISLAHAEDVAIKNAWVRATVPGQPVAAAYMEITSPKPAALIKVETPMASKAEIHSMKME